MATGRVKFFNGDKGYGFIEPEDGTKDVFVHITSISDASLCDFREDRRVSFNERISQRNGSRKRLMWWCCSSVRTIYAAVCV